jgi:hypothetical protein
MTGSLNYDETKKQAYSSNNNNQFEGIEDALIRYVKHNELKALKDSKKIQKIEVDEASSSELF